MRLIGYIRVSKEERDEAARKRRHSLASVQPEAVRALCEREGHTLVDLVVDDGVSADIPFGRRPGGGEVLDRLARDEADGVAVYMLDRLFRLGLDALEVGTWLKHRGLVIASVSDPVDIATRHGWLAFGIQALMAEHERGKIVDRSLAVTERLREQGRPWGPVPFGCVEREGRLFRDPVGWARRERVVALRGEGHSLREVAKRLKAEQIPAPGGGRLWHVSTIRGILDSHHGLQHIPALPADHEAEVS